MGDTYLGFANLPNQVQRKAAKKGFEFTLMVVGESGLGKTTLINSLFSTDLNLHGEIPEVNDLLERTLGIETNSVDIDDSGVRLKLTVVDTPGYGDALDCSGNYTPIVNYVDEQFEKYLDNESGLNRRQIRDSRVHCCFYFISPLNWGLKPADIKFMKFLQNKVNIIPLIAKSDHFTPSEIDTLKKRIREEIKAHDIQIYTLPEVDPEEDEQYKKQVKSLSAAMPFAVSASLEYHEVNGKKVRGRLYPWGVVETDNPAHSDFVKLRSMLVSHMQDLHEVTNEVHYENYRAERLINTPGMGTKYAGLDRSNLSTTSASTLATNMGDIEDRERMLQEKDAELKKMQEMLAKMKEEMRRTKAPEANGH